jgi:hypothetical protein
MSATVDGAIGSSVPPSSQLRMSSKCIAELLRQMSDITPDTGSRRLWGHAKSESRELERSAIFSRRDEYGMGFRDLIETGAAEGWLAVSSHRLASYAILDMGMGVWFGEDGPLHEAAIVRKDGTIALKAVGAF